MTDEQKPDHAFARSLSNAELDAILSGKVLVTFNANDSGILWERLWRWTELDGYQSKTCASGCFTDWHKYQSQDDFLASLQQDISEFSFRGI